MLDWTGDLTVWCRSVHQFYPLEGIVVSPYGVGLVAVGLDDSNFPPFSLNIEQAANNGFRSFHLTVVVPGLHA